MTKAELTVECVKANLHRSGTMEDLSKRLKHYQKSLKKVVDGLMKDKFSIKGVLPKAGETKDIMPAEDNITSHREDAMDIEVVDG